jgi:DNA-directed RNA polymerase specialized sigma24 family protein
MEERVNELLPLAAKIAREFSNIPGLPYAEINLAAQEALANAARHHIYDLDLPITESATTPEARVQQVEARDFPMVDHAAAALESGKRLEIAMLALSPRLRLVAEGIRDGKSYSEIGTMLGVSKQAAHKLAGATISELKDQLEAMGFQGIDTLGFLKSCAQEIRGDSPQVDDFSSRP